MEWSSFVLKRKKNKDNIKQFENVSEQSVDDFNILFQFPHIVIVCRPVAIIMILIFCKFSSLQYLSHCVYMYVCLYKNVNNILAHHELTPAPLSALVRLQSALVYVATLSFLSASLSASLAPVLCTKKVNIQPCFISQGEMTTRQLVFLSKLHSFN